MPALWTGTESRCVMGQYQRVLLIADWVPGSILAVKQPESLVRE
jgi:hypothetical protein